MLIQCPKCHTTYRVSEKLITIPDPTFRCSRCKNIFVLGSRAAPTPTHEPPEPPPSPSQKGETRELSFSFPALETNETAAEKIAEGLDSPIADNAPAPPPEEEGSSFMIQKREDDWSMTPEHPAGEQAFTMREEKPFAQIDRPAERPLEFQREWSAAVPEEPESAHEPTAEPAANQPLSITPYLILCGAVLFLFSALALAHKTRPESVEGLLKTIPWLGSSVLQNNHLRQGIVLQTGRPRFQRIQGNREVFLVSGVAVNRNPVKVREVKVEGTIFNSDGKIIERQITTVGNAISSKIIRDLTSQEISSLQKQGPVKRFEILPNESAAFSIVFLKSSAEIKSFGYRVLSAEET